jgi:hypothetical protein
MSRDSLKIVLTFAAAIVLFAASAKAELLDNYSTNQSSKYTEYTWYGSTGTFGIGSGQFQPTVAVGSGNIWYWTNGERLNPGDSVYADFAPTQSGSAPYGNVAGLALSKTLTSSLADPTCPVDWPSGGINGWQAYVFGTTYLVAPYISAANMPTPETLTRVTFTRGTGANEAVITWSFSQIVQIDGNPHGCIGSGTVTLAGVLATDSLYFGPGFYNSAAGYSAGVAADLNYVPYVVPEPSTLALLAAGLAGLLCYAWRKRR